MEICINLEEIIPDISSIPDITKKLEDLQAKLKDLYKFQDVFRFLAIQIYLKCPSAYKMLQNTLKLPPVPELRKLFDKSQITTDMTETDNCNAFFATVLKFKASIMTEKQKLCVVCVGTTEVRKNLYYDIKRDKLIGIHEIREQIPEVACKAVVMSVQGLFSDWRQLIGTIYMSNCNLYDYTETREYIIQNVTNIIKMGYEVKALVSDINYMNTTSPDCFEIDNTTIPILKDINTMVKWFYYTWFTHDYIFDNKIAKLQHVWDYFDLDRKNIVRLTPNLTEKYVKLLSKEELDIKDITEVFSLQTAAAMSAHVALGTLSPAATHTVLFITAMGELLQSMFPNKYNVTSKQIDLKVVDEILTYFSTMKVVSIDNKLTLPENSTSVQTFCMTIKTMIVLYKDMQMCHYDKTKLLQRLTLENLNSFFRRIKKKQSELTCKRLYYSFIKSSLATILKPIDEKKTDDLNVFLDELSAFIVSTANEKAKEKDLTKDIVIKPSEYKTLNLKRDDAIVLLSGYLQKKCFDRHADCVQFNNYSLFVSHNSDSLCKSILREIHENICIVPQENFIDFVEMMEIRFRSFMTKKVLNTKNGLVNGLMKAMAVINFPMPCDCFPSHYACYAKMLFVRLRIRSLLEFNNRRIFTDEDSENDHVVVNDLYE